MQSHERTRDESSNQPEPALEPGPYAPHSAGETDAEHLEDQNRRRLRTALWLLSHVNATEALSGAALAAEGQIANALDGLAAATEEMDVSISEISRNGGRIAEEAEQSRELTKQGRDETTKALESIREVAETTSETRKDARQLSEASKTATTIVNLIDSIARQTNLLALNATIEASRAGKAGESFAVVAREVKELSRGTADATQKVRQALDDLLERIEVISRRTEQAEKLLVAGMEATGQALKANEAASSRADCVSASVTEISDMIEQQTLATREMSRGLSNIVRLSRENRDRFSEVARRIASVQEDTGEQLRELREVQVRNQALSQAMVDHALWRKQLTDMLSGQSRLETSAGDGHRHCALGTWYYGERGRGCRNLRAYRQLEEPHIQIHALRDRAITAFNQGDPQAAAEIVQEISDLSENIIELLQSLDETLLVPGAG